MNSFTAFLSTVAVTEETTAVAPSVTEEVDVETEFEGSGSNTGTYCVIG